MNPKRKRKHILTLFLLLLLLWGTMFAIDVWQVAHWEKPSFAQAYITADDGGSGVYQGLGYGFNLRGNFLPEDVLYGVQEYEILLFGRIIFADRK